MEEFGWKEVIEGNDILYCIAYSSKEKQEWNVNFGQILILCCFNQWENLIEVVDSFIYTFWSAWYLVVYSI